MTAATRGGAAYPLLAALGTLACIQLLRTGIGWYAVQLIRPGASMPLWDLKGIVEFLATGAVLYVLARPAPADLAIRFDGMGAAGRWIYPALAFLCLAGIASSAFFGPDLLAANLHGSLATPLVEELLFRGWLWGRLEKRLPGKSGWAPFLAVTVLFTLWHLGYADAVSLRTAALHPDAPPIGEIMLHKLPVALCVGILAGLPRWRTGRIFGSLAVHALWNLFGR